jgi:hypothetical protein
MKVSNHSKKITDSTEVLKAFQRYKTNNKHIEQYIKSFPLYPKSSQKANQKWMMFQISFFRLMSTQKYFRFCFDIEFILNHLDNIKPNPITFDNHFVHQINSQNTKSKSQQKPPNLTAIIVANIVRPLSFYFYHVLPSIYTSSWLKTTNKMTNAIYHTLTCHSRSKQT